MSDPARFWAVDLHVHTPASKDVLERQYGKAEPADVVRAALAASLDAIAITDHNTTDWCQLVNQAAKGTSLIVLPGVEITTTEGHLLAVWEENTPVHVLDECLIKLGIGADNRGKLDISATVGIADAAEIIHLSNGVAIAAHADKEKGLLKLSVAAHVKRTLLDPHVSAVEIVGLDLAAEVQRKVGDERRLAFVRGSDMTADGQPGHRLEAIGGRRTWVKASRPDLCGLRHAFEDPELRIRLDDPANDTRHPSIRSVAIAGGFLDGVTLSLSPDLNCLVGGTGTGKSLALECVRYALDQQVEERAFPMIAKEVQSRLAAALGQNNTISVEVIDADGNTFVIERSYDASMDSPPVVRRRLDDGDLIPAGVAPIDVLKISAFSQGEALEYSREQVGRMALIDTSLDLSEIEDRLATLGTALRKNGRSLLKQRTAVAKLRETIEAESELRKRLEELEALFDNDTVKSQKAWQTDDALINSVLKSIPAPGCLELEVPVSASAAKLADNAAFIADAKAIAATAQQAVEKAIRAVDKALVAAQTSEATLRGKWKTRYEAFKTDLNKTLEDLPGKKSLVALRDQLEKIQAQLLQIDETKRTLSDDAAPQLERLTAEREQILTDLMAVRQERRTLRRDRIKELNSKTSGVVKLDLPASGDRAVFRTRLNELKVGSRLNDAKLDAIAGALHPAEFAEAMLNETYSQLAKPDKGVTLDDLSRLYVNIADKDLWEPLLEVQELDTPDTLSIRFRRDGGEYVPIESLAHGQKCTAILVVLLADGDTPVIVDQPEDALHAPWIEEQLVDRLRTLRGQRQYVFATRSPGLVVSADSEQIITLNADAGRGKVEAAGSLERHDLNQLVLMHLEGGRIAFKRRHKKLARSVDGE